MADEEELVMTPSKHGQVTKIQIEKKKKMELDTSQIAHQAGGQHRGIVINKQTSRDHEIGPSDLQLEFKCFLVDQKTGKHVPESRILKFWFREGTDYLDKVTGAYEFFKELVKPDQFPRDYVGFIKKLMKQAQFPKYYPILRVDVEMMPLKEEEAAMMPAEVKEEKPKQQVVQESVLLTLESAYPNIMHIEDLSMMAKADQNMVMQQLNELKSRDLVKEIEPGQWVRKVFVDKKTEVKEVKNMPVHTGGEKPTIAVITSKYYEKMAVDAMMEEKTTFVRYKMEGESNVYTIGYIGDHKVVSTKLPQIGRQRAAQISSGNTTTRLLGTFSDVDHVLLVGVAGGVPHYTDFQKHVRLGDVVVGQQNQRGYMYIFCDQVLRDEAKGSLQYMLKGWQPQDTMLQHVAAQLRDRAQANPQEDPLGVYLQEAQDLLSAQEASFARPPLSSDKLYMNIGGSDMIEVGHPPVPEDARPWYPEGRPVVRFGTIGAGKQVISEDPLRMDFAARHSCVAFDSEFDQVLESIVGNRKESFLFIRGVGDYFDGTVKKEWEAYAALVAAAYMKSLLLALPKPKK